MAPKSTAVPRAPAAESNVPPAPAPAAAAEKVKADRIAPVLTAISAAVPLPAVTKRSRGGNSIYPFEKMEVHQSFGIKNKTQKNMASVITGANKRFMVPKLDANGNPIFKMTTAKAPDGTEIQVPSTEKEMVAGKTFFAADVDPATDPEGASVRVWRIA